MTNQNISYIVEVLDLVAAPAPDVVVMDISTPELSGLETIRQK